jgi:hypothetical protein
VIREPDIELVKISSRHFLDRYRDVVDFEDPDGVDLDGSDLSGVVDFNKALQGLAQRPLSDWLYWRAGSTEFGVSNDAVTLGHDTDDIGYEYVSALESVEPAFPEPEIRAIDTTTQMEID